MNKPVSLYIHIPFCKSKCPYCDFYSARPEEDDVFDRYLAALCARLAVYGEKYGERLLHTVYFGGGTPSVFGAERLCRVLEKVKEQFNVAENAEITTECNPADVDISFFETLKRGGFNRISMGMQPQTHGGNRAGSSESGERSGHRQCFGRFDARPAELELGDTEKLDRFLRCTRGRPCFRVYFKDRARYAVCKARA